MNDPVNNPEGLTLDQAYAQLQASRNPTPDEEQSEEVSEDVVDTEEVESELDTETELEEGDDSGEGEEEVEGEEEADSETEVFIIERDGEEIEVDLEELRNGYLRFNDYTQKRQADAKQAKELEASYQEKLEQLDYLLTQNVSSEQKQYQALQQQYKQATDESTKRNTHYQLLQLQQKIGQQQAMQQEALRLRQQAEQAAQEAKWTEQQELLKGKYEDWDTKKNELVGYLNNQGFVEEDLSMFAHHKMAELVDKAKQFDELQLKRKDVVNKKIKRKVPKVLTPGQGEKKFNLDNENIKQLEAQFAKSGSLKDAMALQKARHGG
jgi:hypothetical protein